MKKTTGTTSRVQSSMSGRAPRTFSFLPEVMRLCFGAFLILAFSPAFAMQQMQDDELSEVTGQALMQMGVTPSQTGTDDLTFYKAGLDAKVELNLNIDKLQLGCTSSSINGQYCDIDIDKVSLSGSSWTAGRPDSAAILTRPFFEFAIKNDDSPTLRQVVGIRLSAENSEGMMTFGDQQAGAGDPGNTSGINSLSGYMNLGSATGTATTEPRPMSYGNYTCQAGDPCTGTYSGTGRLITGRLWLTVLGIINDVVDVSSDDYTLFLDSVNAYVTTDPVAVSGRRMTEVNLTGSATLDPIPFTGNMAAYVENLLGLGINLDLDKEVDGTIYDLTADVPIVESLKFIHKLDVANPFSLSMQSQQVLWPGASVAAEQGWWLSFEDEIDIGNISPEAQVPITNAVLLQAMGAEWASAGSGTVCTVPSINCALFRGLGVRNGDPYGIRCNGLDECLGGSLSIGNVYVPLELTFPLNNLKLSAQAVTPNCWGTSRFC